MIYDLIKKAKQKGLLYSAGWSRYFLDIYINDDWKRFFNNEEYLELKTFQDDLRLALRQIDLARKNRYETGKATREDIVRLLDKHIHDNIDQWGEDYIYTKWAREHKEKVLHAYDNNLPAVEVAKIDWDYKNGFDYEYHLYTDGSIRCSVYGAS